jgi:hypothetical protein
VCAVKNVKSSGARAGTRLSLDQAHNADRDGGADRTEGTVPTVSSNASAVKHWST